jgi:hypothetical protein
MSPWEFWLEFDARAESARRAQRVDVNGKSVPHSVLKEAQTKARAIHKAKKDKAQEAA